MVIFERILQIFRDNFISALLYLENMRRLRIYQYPHMCSISSSSSLPTYEFPQAQSGVTSTEATPEPKFNFHKLAESATKDKTSKRKSRPKKEYICR